MVRTMYLTMVFIIHQKVPRFSWRREILLSFHQKYKLLKLLSNRFTGFAYYNRQLFRCRHRKLPTLYQFNKCKPGKDPRRHRSYNPYPRDLSMHSECAHKPQKHKKLEFKSAVPIQGPVSYRIRTNSLGKV